MNSNLESFSDFNSKVDTELDSAPKNLLGAINFLSKGNINNCVMVLRNIIPEFEEKGDYWAGTTYCCYAYCLKELGYWKEAIEKAIRGDKFGLNLVGYWYYHDVMVNASNFIDNMPDAVKYVNSAIEFYRKRNSPENVAYFLSSKSNILKQLASENSKELNTYKKAKEYVIEAIESLCESIEIIRDEWEKLQEELDALSNIAARVGVKYNDMKALNNFSSIKDIIEKYFSTKTLSGKAASEHQNCAVDAIKKGNRELAVKHYEIAIESFMENEQEDRAFKAFLCYQCGVCLLRLFKLENFNVSMAMNFDLKSRKAVIQIQQHWNDTIRLYKSLSKDFISSFDARFPPGLKIAVKNIHSDYLMKVNINS